MNRFNVSLSRFLKQFSILIWEDISSFVLFCFFLAPLDSVNFINTRSNYEQCFKIINIYLRLSEFLLSFIFFLFFFRLETHEGDQIDIYLSKFSQAQGHRSKIASNGTWPQKHKFIQHN